MAKDKKKLVLRLIHPGTGGKVTIGSYALDPGDVDAFFKYDWGWRDAKDKLLATGGPVVWPIEAVPCADPLTTAARDGPPPPPNAAPEELDWESDLERLEYYARRAEVVRDYWRGQFEEERAKAAERRSVCLRHQLGKANAAASVIAEATS